MIDEFEIVDYPTDADAWNIAPDEPEPQVAPDPAGPRYSPIATGQTAPQFAGAVVRWCLEYGNAAPVAALPTAALELALHGSVAVQALQFEARHHDAVADIRRAMYATLAARERYQDADQAAPPPAGSPTPLSDRRNFGRTANLPDPVRPLSPAGAIAGW